MTDAENQRQRHLAEMLIAQCNGKQVQYRERDGEWIPVPYMIYNIADSDKLRLQWRIKPEPREWFLCMTCHRWCPKGFTISHPNCNGETVLVREVLEP